METKPIGLKDIQELARFNATPDGVLPGFHFHRRTKWRGSTSRNRWKLPG